ncbi:glycosyl transferase [Vreelandella sulfidaeris]|uniref:Glycosyl transferase n=1 Tax=Vreelandella sulfidaeris TaxID=115553 RepID=A0A365TN32_9GAMM|nr:glycosyltransferase [Halomonas sulfidaeris]RBI66240.1 glycosyl transferase [Halomonas sulfidaeris]
MDELPTEESIVSKWDGDLNHPKVSICCAAYNHQAYIGDALTGFLSQQCDFPFEILIHDDASTDETADIIRQYHARYPNIIKPIYQVENQYSKGNKPSRLNHQRAKGEYLAICEGDDYWIDPNKLSQQFQALEKNQDIDLCFHSAYLLDMTNGEKQAIGKYREGDGVVPIESIIQKKCGQLPTASTFVRREVMSEIRKFREARPYLTVGDIYLHFFGAKRGGAFYIDKPMSVYRAFVPGSWTQTNLTDYKKRLKNISARVSSYNELDKLTEYKYHSAFTKANRQWIMRVLKDYRVPYGPKLNFYRQYAHCLTLNERLTFLPIIAIPGAFSLTKVVRMKENT